jgi:hypothetical protein
MVYVPTPVIVPPPEASLEARELAREIEDVILKYQEDHPCTRPQDIRQAMSLASGRAGASGSKATAVVIALVVGILLMGLLTAGLVLARPG